MERPVGSEASFDVSGGCSGTAILESLVPSARIARRSASFSERFLPRTLAPLRPCMGLSTVLLSLPLSPPPQSLTDAESSSLQSDPTEDRLNDCCRRDRDLELNSFFSIALAPCCSASSAESPSLPMVAPATVCAPVKCPNWTVNIKHVK